MSDTAVLLWPEKTGKDEDGFPLEEWKEAEVYVAEKSVKRAEAYEAMRSGISVSLILEIRSEDWEMSAHMINGKKEYARKVRYDGGLYKILRTWKNGKAKVELTCG